MVTERLRPWMRALESELEPDTWAATTDETPTAPTVEAATHSMADERELDSLVSALTSH